MQSQYKIETDRLTKKEWFDISQSFEDVNIYQVWSWGAVRWGQKRLSHLVLKDCNKIIAAAQLWIIKIPFSGSGIAYLKWGPLWQARGSNRNPNNFRDIIRALISEYVEKRRLLLRIMPNVVDGKAEEMYSILREQGFEVCQSSPPYRTLIVDLGLPLETIRKGLKRNWHYDLKQAEKNGLNVIEGCSDDFYARFMDLYNKMRSRKKFAEFLDISDVRAVQKDLPDAVKMRIMICESNGEPVGALVVPLIGKCAVDLFAANSEKALKLKSSFFLQWQAIKRLKDSGCLWYDLGGMDPKNYPGPSYFKAGLSGKHGRDTVFYQFDLCHSLTSKFFVRMIDYLRKTQKETKELIARLRHTSKKLDKHRN
jgi:lipid II:glycine glycyltransferase (peptidoglycan interpeptide bridge formation enzyme)